VILAERPTDPRHRLGLRGEAAAEATLRKAGFEILGRRFRARAGEIDIIAQEGEILVFVEVKTRRCLEHGSPSEAVNPRKRARLALAAQVYLHLRGLDDRVCRFDVVEVLEPSGRTLEVRHLRDAFRLWPTG